jgi:hypothetical protein
MHNTEDKKWWIKHGLKLELDFLSNIAPLIEDDIKLNPEKRTDPMAPDFIFNGELADLKSQNTPFFKADKLYGFDDSKWAVTFNGKDYNRYLSLYPEIKILFYVNWLVLEKTIGGIRYTVDPVNGVWLADIQKIAKFVKDGASSHDYMRRKFDTAGNAKSSFCLDLRKMKCLWSDG